MAFTFGTTSAPNNITTYLDALFSQSLANYRKELIDNIGASNAIYYKIINSDAYQSTDGGTYCAEDLLYGLTPSQPYSGYDTLPTQPTDGITQAIFQWAQQALPIAYNMKEVIQNKHKIIDLVQSKMKQAEMGLQEGFSQALMWGNYSVDGTILNPRSSGTGALDIIPLGQLISYNTAGSSGTALSPGGLNEYSYPWWANHSQTSAATTYSGFLYELESMYNTCALGTGGPPDLILMDQQTYQNFCHAFFSVYKYPAGGSNEYPFEAKKFLNATVVMDDKVPDAYTGAPGTQVGGVVQASTMAYGTAYFINTKFWKIRYIEDRDFQMLPDENGKVFVKPFAGDSRLGHMAWMGCTTINNRRKQGVLAKIARTYAS